MKNYNFLIAMGASTPGDATAVLNKTYFYVFSKSNELYDLVKERYTLYAKDVLGDYIDDLDDLINSMSESIKLNHIRWYSSFDKDLSNNNLSFLKEYLIARKAQLDELWSN